MSGAALGFGAILVVISAVAAVLLTQSRGTPGTSPPASGSPAPPTQPATGGALPAFVTTDGDPAIGMPIPEVDGVSFDGSPVRIAADGRPKLLLFLAHWCPHCQNEVPVVQSWLEADGLPSTIDLISIATAIDPNRPNYPPDAWLTREGWQAPVLVDADDSVATRYGLTAFPFWVAVDADGTVAGRFSGGLSPDQLDALVTALAAS